jgi:hypothetical protein
MSTSLISTPELLALHKEVITLTASSVTQRDINAAAKQQRRHELKLLDTASICPVPQIKTFQDRLPSLKESRLQKLVTDQFYNADVMATALCVTDAVLYTQPVQIGSVSTLMRIRHWIQNLHGSPDTLKAGLATARDLFAVKTILDSEDSDLVHELCVGLFGTNRLRVSVPNFTYIYGGFECSPPIIQDKRVVSWCHSMKQSSTSGHPVNYLLYENIFPGSITLAEYVQSCTASQFLDKYLQVIYALRQAVQAIDFTHYRLTADRVILRPIKSNSSDKIMFELPYVTERGLEYVLTDAVATLTDFSWAHFDYNGEPWGNYHHVDTFVYPRRSFPLADAYKLLCTSMAVMQSSGNTATFTDLATILSFFSSERPVDLIRQQASIGYSLPLTPRVASKNLDDLTRYIRQIQACSFLSPNPGSHRVLGCQGTDFCITTEGMTRLIGLDKPATPETVFDFYAMGTERLSQGKSLDDVKRQFPYDTSTRQAQDKLDHVLTDISQGLKSIRRVDLGLLPITEIFTWTTLEAYRQYLIRVAQLYDQLETANIQITVLKFTAEAYNDQATLSLMDDRYQQLLSLMIPLNDHLASFRDDRKHLESVLDNPVNQEFIDTAIKRDPRLNWYWEGQHIFDYMLTPQVV